MAQNTQHDGDLQQQTLAMRQTLQTPDQPLTRQQVEAQFLAQYHKKHMHTYDTNKAMPFPAADPAQPFHFCINIESLDINSLNTQLIGKVTRFQQKQKLEAEPVVYEISLRVATPPNRNNETEIFRKRIDGDIISKGLSRTLNVNKVRE